ncbi:MAG: M48 family metallopeptidase [Desulfatitalea sp.]|nr:M48 family metallopeptidase [Desulfatitalea sp.]
MNFFEHQERARRRTGLLVVLFVLAVLAIIAGVNLAVALAMGFLDSGWEGLGRNKGVMAGISLATLALIAGATAFRVASLASGGAVVAMGLGGVPVMPDTTDAPLRRLRNVVEEVALASGVPTPQIFVLEKESGINAFAAGYAPTDAVVAVTRGTLDRLNRDELQGVVAHEFSHIVNGDMRLNIRLMGVLFGILAIGVIGRFLLHGSGRSRGGNRGGGAVVMLGLALFLLGYIGVFFGRLIKASVSRQREFLADAAAVQFTRQPAGIAGALKKIAALSGGARLTASDTEEVSHMLFANGMRSLIAWWATHPPLDRRIRAIDPAFRPEEIETLRKQIAWQDQKDAAAAAASAAHKTAGRVATPAIPGMESMPGAGGAIAQTVVSAALLADLEHPDPMRLALAAQLRQALPKALYDAAHDSEAVVPLLLALLLGEDANAAAAHLDHLGGRISVGGMMRVETLAPLAAALDPRHRLPLMDLAIPALRRCSPESLKALLPLVSELVQIDGRVTVFEYALGRLLTRHVTDILKPGRARPGGRVALKACAEALASLFAVVALHGHDNPTAAREAYRTGMATLYSTRHAPGYHPPERWTEALDIALGALDGLALPAKQEMIQGLLATMAHDGVITIEEGELLRAVCGVLHVPLPPLPQGS